MRGGRGGIRTLPHTVGGALQGRGSLGLLGRNHLSNDHHRLPLPVGTLEQGEVSPTRGSVALLRHHQACPAAGDPPFQLWTPEPPKHRSPH